MFQTFKYIFQILQFLGYLLLKMGNRSVQHLQRSVGIGLTLAKRICGPDLSLYVLLLYQL